MGRPFWRRLFGILLIAYGMAGLGLVVGGGVLVASSVATLDGLGQTIDNQRLVLVRSLDATATFLGDARVGMGNVQTSLATTVDSARKTAQLTRNLAAAMDQLSVASTVSIFGSQPFGAITATFTEVSRQATEMGTSLDATADALVRNGGDLEVIRGDLSRIQGEINVLRAELSGAATAPGIADLKGASRTLDALRIVLFGLLIWLAIQAIIAIGVGAAMARPRRAIVVETVPTLIVPESHPTHEKVEPTPVESTPIERGSPIEPGSR
jgi:hypothetical protein